MQPHQIDQHRQENNHNLFRKQGETKTDGSPGKIKEVTPAFDDQVNRDQKPTSCKIIQQYLALKRDAERRESEKCHPQQTNKKMSSQTASNQIDQQRTNHSYQEHEYSSAVYGIPKSAEATGKLYPSSDLYPGQRGMAIAIGIRTNHPMYNGPRVHDVSTFILLIMTVIEHVNSMGCKRTSQNTHD